MIFKSSCMNCHGNPKDAPVEMLEIYGDKNGFHYTPGEVGGVVVAGFPVDLIKTPAKEITRQYLTLYLLGILLFAVMISVFFDQLVMKNLHNLTAIFRSRFSGKDEQRLIERLGKNDEIEGLIQGIDEIAVCLSDARKKLEDYAENLAVKVDKRTKEIQEKAEKHRADVGLFLKMLAGFGSTSNTGEVISRALESIGKRFHANQVIYHCTVASENAYAWRQAPEIEELPGHIKGILWKDEVLQMKNRWYIPVKSLESHWGILCVSWKLPRENGDIDTAFLLALGQQLAILIENIQAFSNVKFQNDMLQSVFEGISDPLLLIDAKGTIFMANRGSGEILAQKEKKEREEKLKKFLSIQDNAPPAENILKIMAEREEPVSREVKTGDNRSFRVSFYPLPRRKQADLKIVVYARDITLEKQMVQRMQQAERLSSVGKMAAGIAHEINNPLGVVRCYTDLVSDAATDPEMVEDLKIIEKHTITAQNVVQDLLTLSRPKPLVYEGCRINTVILDAVKVFQAQSASKEIQVISRLENQLPEIQCSTDILEQILTNIWINAFDALQETGGEVTITTAMEWDSGEVLLTIQDNGPGIPKELLENIFDPFFTTKAVGKGTVETAVEALKKEALDHFSRNYLDKVFEKTRGNIAETSRISGLERASIQKIVKRLAIDMSLYRG
ncbi:MAG: histidine kinase dimerization/phospho-acceptor domain-containing protein [Desulfobacteraceae bacterium]